MHKHPESHSEHHCAGGHDDGHSEHHCAGGHDGGHSEHHCAGGHDGGHSEHRCAGHGSEGARESSELEGRAGVFLLASLLAGYPRDGFEHSLARLLANEDVRQGAADADEDSWSALETALRENLTSHAAVDALRSDYIDLFDRGAAASPLYESSYDSAQAFGKTRALADITGFYHAYGLNVSEGDQELPDHIAVELEFYTVLLVKQSMLEAEGDDLGVEIVLDTRRKFLLDHLGRFAGAIAAQPVVLEHPLFGRIFRWCGGLIADECARLEIQSDASSPVLQPLEEEGNECGQVKEFTSQQGFPC